MGRCENHFIINKKKERKGKKGVGSTNRYKHSIKSSLSLELSSPHQFALQIMDKNMHSVYGTMCGLLWRTPWVM